MIQDRDFTHWWLNVGSGFVPHKGIDAEEHAGRVAKAAFHHGVEIQRQACSKEAGINAMMREALEKIATGATGYADRDSELAAIASKALDDAETIKRFVG